MASSDHEYDVHMSDDEEDENIRGAHNRNRDRAKQRQANANKPKVARWEAGAQKNWDLNEGSEGLEATLLGLEEASKRAR